MGSIHYLNNHLEKFRENKFTIDIHDIEQFAQYDNLQNNDKKITKLFVKCFKNKETYRSLMEKLPKDFEKISLHKLVTNYWVAYTCYYEEDNFDKIISNCLDQINENVFLLDSPHFCKKMYFFLNPLTNSSNL